LAKIWKLKIYIWIIKYYTGIDQTVNTQTRISCEKNRSWTKWANISKEHLKIPKRFSEAVVFENFLKGLKNFYDNGTVHQLS
jgi:hypothetical protein